MLGRISVIVPVYNTADYLEQCVTSILGQDYSDLEAILIDDGSTDNSGALCDDFARLDNRVKVIHQQNAGLSEARNRGLSQSTGSIICYVDSDDWLPANCLMALAQGMIEYGADIAIGQTVVSHGGEPATPSASTTRRMTGKELLEWPERVYPVDTVSVCGKLIRRDLHRGIDFPKGRLHEDAIVSMQLFHKARVVACVDQPVYVYRQREGSITWGTWSLRSRADKSLALI